jgi:hypothetical protein
MPLLNPGAIVCASPFLSTRFQVRRRAATTGSNGRGKTADVIPPCAARGIITAKGDNGMDRQEGGSTATSTIIVVTKYPLRKQAAGILPDQVLYRGIEYVVIDVEDYLDFGAGWVEATCTSDQIADVPVARR